jgi:hypothetical protein
MAHLQGGRPYLALMRPVIDLVPEFADATNGRSGE